MRMIMTPHEVLDGLLNSEAMDDLVAYRLQLSLENTLTSLERLAEIKNLTPYQWEDYIDHLQYGRGLVTVLQWFTMDDQTEATVELNKHSIRLNSEF